MDLTPGRQVAQWVPMRAKIPIDRDKIATFCQRWKIAELALFGSVLRDDFGPESDVDVLVGFAPNAEWSLWDHVAMEEELSGLLGRQVDLVTRRSVERSENWIRRKAILSSAEPLYAVR
jgi:predicted nucleotidyltransferase